MNLIYFRKSKLSLEKIIENIKTACQSHKIQIINEEKIENGYMLTIFQKDWVKQIVKEDIQLAGIIPSVLVVVEKDNGTQIGVPNAQILSGISQNPHVGQVAQNIHSTLTRIMQEAGEIEELKVKNVKIFSTTTCPYCKMEEAWLKDNNVAYDLSLVDMNQKDAQYMVEKTGQMGVPVTEIQYEDADSEFVIGFDKPRLAQLLQL